MYYYVLLLCPVLLCTIGHHVPAGGSAVRSITQRRFPHGCLFLHTRGTYTFNDRADSSRTCGTSNMNCVCRCDVGGGSRPTVIPTMPPTPGEEVMERPTAATAVPAASISSPSTPRTKHDCTEVNQGIVGALLGAQERAFVSIEWKR